MEYKKARLNPIEITYLQWEDNYHEMKAFCGDSCIITYEVCAIDGYFFLKLEDSLVNNFVSVPLHDYVIKFGEHEFTHISPEKFKTIFTIVEK